MKNKVLLMTVMLIIFSAAVLCALPLWNGASFPSYILQGTITAVSSRAEFSGDGATTTFDFSFPLLATSDLKLYHRVDSTGVETLLTETTDYSLSATNNDYSSGGTITTVATYASGITLVAIRDTPNTQNTDLEDSGILRVQALEDALDKLTMLVEQHDEVLNRCLKYPVSDASSLSSELPNSVDRASTTLIFDASSEPDVE